MSMLDSFFSRKFNGAKCKTLLKLTIPRIKLLRNRREIQIKQMRRDIAKLLETGQEATARIRVEHIIREENMMAAQEIIELFCELIVVRLPIIETQRECPLDLKEAISSVCFAAPRCADLSELLQVQMLFSAKYGKEFVSAASELMPDSGVNRQIIELLSVRAPPPEVKLKLLKEIAEEHELDWDPAAAETELFKPHEDLLNGPTQFVGGSKLPLPKEKSDVSLYSAPVEATHEESDSDSGLDSLDLPEVPRVSLRPIPDTGSAPEVVPPPCSASSPELDHEPKISYGGNENSLHESSVEHAESVIPKTSQVNATTVSKREDKQFLPFISPPSLSSASFSARERVPAPVVSRTKSEARSEVNVDLQDVLAAAQAAAESAERAAAAARSAASLAQVRITEHVKKKGDQASQNSEHESHTVGPDQSATAKILQFDSQQSFGSLDSDPSEHGLETLRTPTFNNTIVGFESSLSTEQVSELKSTYHQFQKSTSMEDDPYFSYPNLFKSRDSNLGSGDHSSLDNSPSSQKLPK